MKRLKRAGWFFIEGIFTILCWLFDRETAEEKYDSSFGKIKNRGGKCFLCGQWVEDAHPKAEMIICENCLNKK